MTSTTNTRSAPALTLLEARRGIYIDFEGRKDAEPVLLGVLWVPRQGGPARFMQYVMDRRFRSAAAPPATEFRPFAQAIELLVQRAEKRRRVVIGWSWHERKEVATYAPQHLERFDAVYRDGKRAAERWRSILHPGLEIERDGFQAKHRLDVYAERFGLERPRELGVKAVGTSLGRLGAALEMADFAELSERRKDEWKRILGHNAYDCEATRRVCIASLEALEHAGRS